MMGGLERYISELFSRSGLSLHALAPDMEDARTVDATLPFDVTRYRYDPRWARGQRPLIPMAIAAARRVMTTRPSIIYSDQVQSSGVGLPIARLLGVPHVVFAYARELSPAKLHRVKRVAFRASDAIIAISSFTKEAVEREFDIASDKIALVRPGVDLDKFTPSGPRSRLFGLSEEDVVLLAVGRLDAAQPYKGYERSIRLVARLRSTHPNLKLIIVGHGSDRERLTTLTGDLSITDRVHFAGRLPESDLLDLYRRADVFVHPSGAPGDDPYAVEGYGIVFAEAAACGTPSVGFAVGGAVDAVEPDITGILTSATDAAYTDAVVALVGDESRRSAMRLTARQHAERHFGWDPAIAALRELDARLLASQPSSRNVTQRQFHS